MSARSSRVERQAEVIHEPQRVSDVSDASQKRFWVVSKPRTLLRSVPHQDSFIECPYEDSQQCEENQTRDKTERLPGIASHEPLLLVRTDLLLELLLICCWLLLLHCVS